MLLYVSFGCCRGTNRKISIQNSVMSSFVTMFISVCSLNGVILQTQNVTLNDATLCHLQALNDITYCHSRAVNDVTSRHSHVTSLTGTEWWHGRRRSQWRFSACPAGDSDPRCCRVDLQTSQCSEEPSHHDYRPSTHNRDYYSYTQLSTTTTTTTRCCGVGGRGILFSCTEIVSFVLHKVLRKDWLESRTFDCTTMLNAVRLSLRTLATFSLMTYGPVFNASPANRGQ